MKKFLNFLGEGELLITLQIICLFIMAVIGKNLGYLETWFLPKFLITLLFIYWIAIVLGLFIIITYCGNDPDDRE